MLKYLLKLRRKKAFTLVELIVVIAIIGVLVAIMIPTMLNYYRDSKIKTANATAYQIKNIISTFMAEMEIDHYGMKQTKGVNAQIMFMVNKGQWLVKTECKVNGKNDTDGSLTFFDHKNWWKNNATAVLLDTTTRKDPNHQLALCRAVADSCQGLDSAFIMAFFSSGVCRGVIYIPDCNYLWPGTYSGVPNDMKAGRPQKRATIVRSLRVEGAPALKEFSPWAGVWPESADETIWNGVAGVDIEGYIVGTAPVIGIK